MRLHSVWPTKNNVIHLLAQNCNEAQCYIVTTLLTCHLFILHHTKIFSSTFSLLFSDEFVALEFPLAASYGKPFFRIITNSWSWWLLWVLLVLCSLVPPYLTPRHRLTKHGANYSNIRSPSVILCTKQALRLPWRLQFGPKRAGPSLMLPKRVFIF